MIGHVLRQDRVNNMQHSKCTRRTKEAGNAKDDMEKVRGEAGKGG